MQGSQHLGAFCSKCMELIGTSAHIAMEWCVLLKLIFPRRVNFLIGGGSLPASGAYGDRTAMPCL